jgi:hypothetical protein
MHGGFPGIGFSTIIYGAVWLATSTGRTVRRLRGDR